MIYREQCLSATSCGVFGDVAIVCCKVCIDSSIWLEYPMHNCDECSVSGFDKDATGSTLKQQFEMCAVTTSRYNFRVQHYYFEDVALCLSRHSTRTNTLFNVRGTHISAQSHSVQDELHTERHSLYSRNCTRRPYIISHARMSHVKSTRALPESER